MTALRLLLERNKTDVGPQLEKFTLSEKHSLYGRIHALWLLSDLWPTVASTSKSVLMGRFT